MHWCYGVGSVRGSFLLRANFGLSENCGNVFILPENFWSENQNLGLRTNPLFWANLGGKIEILSTHILLCQKFSGVCGKLQLPTLPSFFNT